MISSAVRERQAIEVIGSSVQVQLEAQMKVVPGKSMVSGKISV